VGNLIFVRRILVGALALGVVWIVLVLIYFPYAIDAEPSQAEVTKTIAFYQQAYDAPTANDPNEDIYVQVAEPAARRCMSRSNYRTLSISTSCMARRYWRLEPDKAPFRTSSTITPGWIFPRPPSGFSTSPSC
jgi:hypothetical protein